MVQQLQIEELREDGRSVIGTLEFGETLIGREPEPDGIAVDNHAVSRNHGVFNFFGSHWFYQDLGSTNGSWVNGIPSREGHWKVIRSGDFLQIANTALKFVSPDGALTAPETAASLLIFSGTDFLSESVFSDPTRGIEIGGEGSEFPVPGSLDTVVVFENRAGVITATPGAGDGVTINGEELVSEAPLRDGDEIEAGSYSILFNDPSSVLARQEMVDEMGMPSFIRDWTGEEEVDFESYHDRAPSNPTFGQVPVEEDGDDTFVLGGGSARDSGVRGFDRHPSMRYIVDDLETGYSFSSLENKIILIIGFVLLLALLCLAVWWALA